MNIETEINEDKGQFFIKEGDEKIALMDFSLRPDRMVIEHTEVDEKYKGNGIGKKLVDFAAYYARGKHLKIIPLCPFTRAIMKKSDEYTDLL